MHFSVELPSRPWIARAEPGPRDGGNWLQIFWSRAISRQLGRARAVPRWFDRKCIARILSIHLQLDLARAGSRWLELKRRWDSKSSKIAEKTMKNPLSRGNHRVPGVSSSWGGGGCLLLAPGADPDTSSAEEGDWETRSQDDQFIYSIQYILCHLETELAWRLSRGSHHRTGRSSRRSP